MTLDLEGIHDSNVIKHSGKVQFQSKIAYMTIILLKEKITLIHNHFNESITE